MSACLRLPLFLIHSCKRLSLSFSFSFDIFFYCSSSYSRFIYFYVNYIKHCYRCHGIVSIKFVNVRGQIHTWLLVTATTMTKNNTHTRTIHISSSQPIHLLGEKKEYHICEINIWRWKSAFTIVSIGIYHINSHTVMRVLNFQVNLWPMYDLDVSYCTNRRINTTATSSSMVLVQFNIKWFFNCVRQIIYILFDKLTSDSKKNKQICRIFFNFVD